MTESRHLMPPSSGTPTEKSISHGIDYIVRVSDYIDDIRGFKYERPLNETVGPWLVQEYGLGGISKYFDTSEETIDAGIPWSRIRGTEQALMIALGWIGYDSSLLHDAWAIRRMWSRYQVEMGVVPDPDELELLLDAEYLLGLSDPARSFFFRGFEGYDVRVMEWGDNAWGDTIWGDDSGVRVPGGTALWSHGRFYSVPVALTADQKAAMQLDFTDGSEVNWGDFPWIAPGLTWTEVTDAVEFHGWLMEQMSTYVGFYDASYNPIGYRRAIHNRDVTDELPPVADTAFVEVRCRTDFGEGFGSTAAYVKVLFHSRHIDLTKPGRLWLEPGEIEIDPAYDQNDTQTDFIALPIEFGRTIREEVTITVEI